MTPTLTETGVKVTPENYIRAETDRTFLNGVKQTGGVNRLFHYRKPTPLDKQTVVRMNRDTLYSVAIVDTSKGATINVPAWPGDGERESERGKGGSIGEAKTRTRRCKGQLKAMWVPNVIAR